MRNRHSWSSVITVMLVPVLAVACSSAGRLLPPDQQLAYVRVLNTAPGGSAIDVLVDGEVVFASLASGSVSPTLSVPSGAQSVAFLKAGAVAAPNFTTMTFAAGDTTTLLAVDSNTVLNPWVLTDTGATVAAGKSKLRVVHFAASAPAVLFYRTQPDYPSLVSVMFPFHYRDASPYLESTPGDWSVIMATEHYTIEGAPFLTDTLYASGSIAIPAGTARTVVFMDAPGGGYQTVVLTP
jgi:hypothetical protein